MKKILSFLLAAVLMLSCLGLSAFAEEQTGSDDWIVSFDGSKMQSNFDSKSIADKLSELQPGDTVNFTVDLKNNSSRSSEWYMANEVLQTLEETKDIASAGGYTYILTYTNSAGTEKKLYSNEQVGGEAGVDTDAEGLLSATSALKDYFLLDTLSSGAKASVKLSVTLDGESQGNSYNSTNAKLQLKFAVEDVPENGKKTNTFYSAKTGDSNNMILWFSVMAVSIAVIVILLVPRRKGKGERKR